MGKIFRILGLAVAALVVLVVVAAVVLPLLIDPNDFKGQIVEQVRDKTGRSLEIEGDIALSVFPWLGLAIGPTRLSNAPGFGAQPFVEVQAVQVRLQLLPLLRKDVVMDTVVLDGLHLHLAKDEQGVSNWADLGGAPADAAETADQAVAPEDSAKLALAGLAIGGVRMNDARVIWEDRHSGVRFAIEDLALNSGAIVPGQPVDLALSLRLTASQPAMAGEVAFDGAVWVSDSLQQIKLSGADLRADLKGAGLPGGAVDARLQTDLELDLEQQTLALPQLVLKALGVQLSGPVQGRNLLGEQPRFSAQLSVREFVPRELAQRLGVALPPSADATVLGKADAKFRLAATPEDLKVDQLALRLDASKLSGSLQVANFAKPALRFDLTLDQIDVDRYLPAPTPAPPATPAAAAATGAGAPGVAGTPGAAAAAGAAQLPLETLRALDIAGTLKIGALKAYQLRSSDVLVTLKAKDGVLRAHPAQAKLYQGQYAGDLRFDVRQDTPRIAMNEKLSGVQAGPLLKDLMGDDRLEGEANVQAKLTGKGVTPELIRKTLNGNASFAFTNGRVKGVDLTALIAQAEAALKGKPAATDTGPKETRFSELRGSATIRNGLVQNNDLSAQSPYLRVDGKGNTHLARETIDYLLTAKIVASPEGQGGKVFQELKGLAIPVKIGGSYSAPTYKVQLDKVLADKVKAEAKEKIEDKQQEVEQKLKKKLEDKLFKGLFR